MVSRFNKSFPLSHALRLMPLLLLGACSPQAALEKFTSPAEQAVARQYIDDLRHRQFAAIEKDADPTIASPDMGNALERMADLIPAGDPTSIKLVGAQRFTSAGATTVNLTFEYEFADRWLLTNVMTKTKDGATSLIGFHVDPETASLEVTNRFSWMGKGALQYGVLAAACIAALFSLIVLVVCIRTTMARRKWLWILFILFGFGKLWVNWTTGEWGIQLLAFQLFSASSFSALYGPWIVSVSLPVGALVFLAKRKRLAVQAYGTAKTSMNIDDFWELIGQAYREAPSDSGARERVLARLLEQLPTEALSLFAEHFDASVDTAYTWPLWGAAYVIGGGCSDDAFADFRGSLISRGRAAFEQAMSAPDSLVEIDLDETEWFHEGFAYVPTQVLKKRLGTIRIRSKPAPAEPIGAPWSEEDLPTLFPRLSAKYG